MKTDTPPTEPLPFALTLLMPRGVTLAPGVRTHIPPSPTFFVGWGGIRAPDVWPDVDPTKPATAKSRSAIMRGVLAGCANLAALDKGIRRVVIGSERSSAWLQEKPDRSADVILLHVTIWNAVKLIYGLDVEVAFSGQEDELVGDFQTPMLGRGMQWEPSWEWRQPLPFIAKRYGAPAGEVARMLARMASTMGLGRGVEAWLQERDAEGQIANLAFVDEVVSEFSRIMRGGGVG